MNVIELYAVLIGGMVCSYIIARLIAVLTLIISPHLLVAFTHYVQYPLVLRRRYWMSVTRLEALIFIGYLAVNITVMSLSVQNRSDLSARAAFIAVINAVPLFLGSRTSIFTNLAGMTLPTYHLAHHWIGRVVVLQGLLHAVLVIDRSILNQTTVSGYVAAGVLLAILCTSIWFVRKFTHRIFKKLHSALALAALVIMFWHVLHMRPESRIPLLIASGLWAASFLVRLLRIVFFSTGAIVKKQDLEIIVQASKANPRLAIVAIETGEGVDVQKMARESVSVRVQTARPIRVFPGSYFYVFLPGGCFHYSVFRSYPLYVAWHEPDQLLSKEGITDISFLKSPYWRTEYAELKAGDKLYLEGPYGHDLSLGKYETVVLIAKGTGIAGVLSSALYLAKRRQHDLKEKDGTSHKEKDGKPHMPSRLFRDMTRKVSILWILDENTQWEWATPELKALRDMDSGNNFLLIWCVHSLLNEELPIDSKFSRCFYSNDEKGFIDAIIGQDARAPGKTIVTTCGDADFTYTVRQSVIQHSKTDRPVYFAESEYRPHAPRRSGASLERGVRSEEELKADGARLIRMRKRD